MFSTDSFVAMRKGRYILESLKRQDSDIRAKLAKFKNRVRESEDLAKDDQYKTI